MIKSNIEYIAKALQLERLGRRTAFKLFDNLEYRISSDEEFYDFISENTTKYRLPNYTKSDWDSALRKYDKILLGNEKNRIKTVSFYDDEYPELYKDIIDKPILLNYIGDISKVNNMASVAVIGTREPSESGAKAAVRFGEIFGEKGFNVVSGLAIGCDAGGHNGCLNKSGFTSAILAHGLDHIYPKENKELAERIIESGGLIISEYFVGMKPFANYFIERDRLQAGLSNGIIVVETDIKGGTMHTVKFAKENNRRIAAFNHVKSELLQHPKTQGNQMLINEGTAFSLGSKEDIDKYLSLLSDDFSKNVNHFGISKISTKELNSKDGSQLNIFK
jgi:DNA processing protein